MALKVRKVNPLSEKNAPDHHTSNYEIRDQSLILRRGQAFDISLIVNRPYEESEDSVTLVFEFVPRASTADEALSGDPSKQELREEEKLKVFSPEVSVRGVRASVTVTPDVTTQHLKTPCLSNDTWDAVVTEFKDNELGIEVMVPANAQVGYWKMTVETSRKETEWKNGVLCSYAMLVLFNPWCPEDLVHVEGKDDRSAHVERERIRLCYYDETEMWDAAPFAADTVRCVLLLLGEVSRIRPLERANPVLVARALCRGINSDGAGGVDDNGLLVANWGDYDDGTEPWDWTGSAQIFKQYLDERTSVKYGQCYTFAALMVSACRAIGIPCRSVTAYSPGVDVDASLTIDKSDDLARGADFLGKRDFNWHFHVWNEVWMARPDLPDGYAGWQALDSCPVRGFRTGVLTSIGPVPVKAIKEGHVGIGYDAHVMFSTVNADVLNFRDGKLYDISTDKIGEQVLTEKIYHANEDKALPARLVERAEDITSLYKYLEGTPEERAAVRRAMCHVQYVYGELRRGVVKKKPLTNTFKLNLKTADAGSNYVRFDNLSAEERLVKYEVKALNEENTGDEENEISPLNSAVTQNGFSEQNILIQKGEVTLKPRQCALEKIVLNEENDTETLKNENSKVFMNIMVSRP